MRPKVFGKTFGRVVGNAYFCSMLLNKEAMKKITVAIDGHSSCGKSTMAKDLARRVGYVYVDISVRLRFPSDRVNTIR